MLYLAGIQGDSIVDGPGIRTAFFAQGCPHHCPGCHNPETWPFEGGTRMEESALVTAVTRNPAQAEGFAELARLLKEKGYEVASYTGYTFEQLLDGTEAQKALLAELDVLVDGPFLQEQRTLELAFRGSRNQRILDVPASLAAGKAVEIASGRWQGEY